MTQNEANREEATKKMQKNENVKQKRKEKKGK